MAVKTGALKDYLDANKRGSRLVGPIERHLLTRPQDLSRSTTVFHPSEIVREDWCHRASYLAVMAGEVPTKERHSLRTESIFAEGHSIHAKWQGWIGEMGVLYGLWRLEDGTEVWGTSEEYPGAEYREVPLRDDDLRISGHSDGWVVGLGDDYLIEIKSVGTGSIRMEAPALLTKHDNNAEAAWNDIRAPFRTHFLQGQVYLHLLHLMAKKGLISREAPEEIVFLLEYKANQAAKEFVVRYSPDYLASILESLDAILAMTEAPECNHSAPKGCKKCRAFEDAPE